MAEKKVEILLTHRSGRLVAIFELLHRAVTRRTEETMLFRGPCYGPVCAVVGVGATM